MLPGTVTASYSEEFAGLSLEKQDIHGLNG